MSRVLVTGASGLIGPHAVAALQARGFHVVVLGRRAMAGVESIAADLLDPEARTAAVRKARASHLLHLAWHDAPQRRWTAADNLDWAAATLGLMREFGLAGGKRAVGVGSCAEYEWSGARYGEDMVLKPSSLYGQAKAASGSLLMAGAEACGLSLAWARVFFCYGPNEPQGRLLGDLIQGLRAGQPVECTDGLQARDFLYAADLGMALATILASNLAGAVNVGSGHATPVRDLILTTARLMGRPDLIRLGARARPAGDPAVIEADVSRLSQTGFAPHYDLEAGLRDCLRRSGVAVVG